MFIILFNACGGNPGAAARVVPMHPPPPAEVSHGWRDGLHPHYHYLHPHYPYPHPHSLILIIILNPAKVVPMHLSPPAEVR